MYFFTSGYVLSVHLFYKIFCFSLVCSCLLRLFILCRMILFILLSEILLQ
jgi:hypothetical protein